MAAAVEAVAVAEAVAVVTSSTTVATVAEAALGLLTTQCSGWAGFWTGFETHKPL